MALFNYATKEITLKIVYYGPGLSGKTTNLQYLHASLNPETKGKLLSLSTEADRTLFFDFLPVELGKIRDFSIRFQLYTVPGQIRYNATRKIVLKGADAVIFVADSQADMKEQNIESFENMMDNLRSNNINPEDIPIILQYNKRDLKNILSVNDLEHDLNPHKKFDVLEASALNGAGVEDTYKLTTKLLLKNIAKKHRVEILPVHPEGEPAPVIPEGSNADVPPTPDHAPSGVEAEEAYEIPEYTLQEFSQDDFVTTAGSDISPELKPDETGPVASGVTAGDQPLHASGKDERGAGRPAEKKKKVPAYQHYDTMTKETSQDKQPEVIIKEVREVPVLPLDKINSMVAELGKISGTLSSMKDSITALHGTVSLLSKDIRELKEVRREQKETNNLLKGLIAVFEKLQSKKSWFRFG